MPQSADMRKFITERRHADYERNRRFEEMTDLAERLGYPIHTTIDYDLCGDQLIARTDTKRRAFTEQTFQAMQDGRRQFTGDQAFEAVRRTHEHAEAMQAEQLARGELAGNVLIKVSKVPDAVVEGTTSIKGYRRDLLRSFVRVYRRTEHGVSCTLFTLDHMNQSGMERVAGLIGMDLTSRNSEDILADHVVVDTDDSEAFVLEFVDAVISQYDEAVYAMTSKRTHAGSYYLDQYDAQTTVQSQPNILREHFEAIAMITGMALNDGAKEDLREIERQRTAAAISLASRGYEITSAHDAAVSTEVAQGNYDRECPTATENGMSQGEAEKEIAMTCPYCGLTTVGDPCAFRLVCQKCDAEVRGGKLMSKGIGRSAAIRRGQQNKVKESHEQRVMTCEVMSNEHMIQRRYGEKAVMYAIGILGGVRYEIVDSSTGQVIDNLSDLRRLA